MPHVDMLRGLFSRGRSQGREGKLYVYNILRTKYNVASLTVDGSSVVVFDMIDLGLDKRHPSKHPA